ncbi:MAG: hypothetical protein L3K06_08500, partial [Thermoplasmata archaeon]|nr:hypothetical protein [Thermoplasmata archaeon]
MTEKKDHPGRSTHPTDSPAMPIHVRPATEADVPALVPLLIRLKRWEDGASWEEFYAIYHPLVFGAAAQAG